MSKTIDRPRASPVTLRENLAEALDEGVGGAVDSLPPWLMEAPASFPIQVTFPPPGRAQRFWAIPLIGFLAKVVVLIPHMVVLAFLVVPAMLAQLILWIPVLSRGEYPAWGYVLVGGTIRWMLRVEAFFLGLTDEYPPFSLGDENGAVDSYPVDVVIPRPLVYNRAWALPIAGLLVKIVLLIPHLVILRVLQIVTVVLQLVIWVPVLSRGEYPEWGYRLVGGYLRWSTRVSCYLFGLTDEYPLFQMG